MLDSISLVAGGRVMVPLIATAWKNQLLRRLAKVLGSLILFLGISVWGPEIVLWLSNLDKSIGKTAAIVILLAMFLWSFLPLILVIPTVQLAFSDHSSRQARLALVIFSYVTSILLFTCFYFLACCLSDYYRAASQSVALRHESPIKWADHSWVTFRDEFDRKTVNDSPALRGTTSHVLIGLLDELDDVTLRRIDDPWNAHPSMPAFIKVLNDEEIPVAQLNSGDRLPLLVECFHFSVVTAATVGYGEIHPANTIMRLVVDFQIIASTTILLVGLGLAMSDSEAKFKSPV